MWDLSRDISYNSNVSSMKWDETSSSWQCVINDGQRSCTAWSVVLCTGFASKRFVPDFTNRDHFTGEIHHTAMWPQQDVDLHNKRVAVIGTGASGVQVIQEVGKIASQLTVYQRTPNTALPMTNPDIDEARNTSLKNNFPETKKMIDKTFAGFDYEFAPGKPTDVSHEERMRLYEKLYNTGGLHFWLGTYQDVLFQPEPNEEAYQFWRTKTLARINDPTTAESLAPASKIHPFGTKRISLEQSYFEVYNQPNVTLINLRTSPITTFTPTGITTTTTHHDFDVIILATGFDSITGGITQIDIRNATNLSIASKWKEGVYTNLGMTTNSFPNLFFTYGPQAPTAFATGPSSAETQGKWIVACLKYMRDNNIRSIDAERAAEEEWRRHVNEVADKSLFPLAESWYFGGNVPGKKREALNYMGGLPEYRRRCWEGVGRGYVGFRFGR